MWHWVFMQIFFGLICTALSEAPECPPQEDVHPCSCSNDYYLTSIDCLNIRSLDQLKPVLQKNKSLNMSYAFRNSNLGDIPSDFFDGQKSVNLHFEDCKIGSFGKKPFSGLENSLKRLYVLDSVNKRVKDLEVFPLGHLKKLEFLEFQGNDIKRLGNDWFEGGPEALTDLMLEANDIEELGDKAFASLVNLRQVWMGDNRFKTIKRSMFPRPAEKLELIEFSFSGIEELPEDIFEDMPVLKDVNVAGNKLKSVPEATWGKIWNQLNEVYLERNAGFECDEKLKWIYQRRLPRILTGQCSGGKFAGKKLSELTLGDFN